MGIGRILFDNELLQRFDIEDTKKALRISHDQARKGIRRTRESVEALEDDLAVMALYVRTLRRLMVEKGVFTRAEFAEALRAIDLQDGTADGKYAGPIDAP
jgi:hypothetical protein